MGRKKRNKDAVILRISPEKRDRLEKALVQLGFTYCRGGNRFASWSKWVEAIADGDIICYKKIPLDIDNDQ